MAAGRWLLERLGTLVAFLLVVCGIVAGAVLTAVEGMEKRRHAARARRLRTPADRT
jgi:UPF0716 family protein affecting phage T7 exclusion